MAVARGGGVANLIRVCTAILRQLRLLIACLFLAVAARPAVSALETPRAVAVFVASASVRPADDASSRVAAQAESRSRAPRLPSVTAHLAATDIAAPRPTAAGRTPFHGTSPLYLTQERFLL